MITRKVLGTIANTLIEWKYVQRKYVGAVQIVLSGRVKQASFLMLAKN